MGQNELIDGEAPEFILLPDFFQIVERLLLVVFSYALIVHCFDLFGCHDFLAASFLALFSARFTSVFAQSTTWRPPSSLYTNALSSSSCDPDLVPRMRSHFSRSSCCAAFVIPRFSKIIIASKSFLAICCSRRLTVPERAMKASEDSRERFASSS